VFFSVGKQKFIWQGSSVAELSSLAFFTSPECSKWHEGFYLNLMMYSKHYQ